MEENLRDVLNRTHTLSRTHTHTHHIHFTMHTETEGASKDARECTGHVQTLNYAHSLFLPHMRTHHISVTMHTRKENSSADGGESAGHVLTHNYTHNNLSHAHKPHLCDNAHRKNRLEGRWRRICGTCSSTLTRALSHTHTTFL